eukprot:507756-Rhodomonas_salina.1
MHPPSHPIINPDPPAPAPAPALPAPPSGLLLSAARCFQVRLASLHALPSCPSTLPDTRARLLTPSASSPAFASADPSHPPSIGRALLTLAARTGMRPPPPPPCCSPSPHPRAGAACLMGWGPLVCSGLHTTRNGATTPSRSLLLLCLVASAHVISMRLAIRVSSRRMNAFNLDI